MPPRKRARHARAKIDPQVYPILPEKTRGMKVTGTAGRKKPRTTARTPTVIHSTGRHGARMDMLSMPLHILVEIYRLLHPRDLVTLARTSKALRGFLMSRTSAPFWRAARQQVEPSFPDCPTFLSEPAYADLVFFPYCHNCARPNVKTVIWEFLARYCLECKEDMLRNPENGQGYSELMWHRNAFNRYKARSTRDSSNTKVFYHGPEVDRFLVRFSRSRWKDGMAEYFEQAVENVKLRKQFARAMREWEIHRDEARTAEAQAIREVRLEGIKHRLRDEGWDQELSLMTDSASTALEKLKPIRQARQLTDRAWQSMRDEVVAFMEKARAERLVAEYAALLSRRLALLQQVFAEWEQNQFIPEGAPHGPYSASFADLALVPFFRTLVEAPSSDTELTKAELKKHEKEIATSVQQWYEARQAEIIDMITKAVSSQSGPANASPLSLAIATFDCRICARTGMRWQAVLAHQCARSVSACRLHNTTDEGYKEHLLKACEKMDEPCMWTNVFVFNSVHDRVRTAIRACGKDPDTVKYAQMEACGVRLICKTCVAGKRVCDVFDWKTAARHGCRILKDKRNDQLRVVEKHSLNLEPLDAHYMPRVRWRERTWQARRLQEHILSPQARYGCNFGCRVYLNLAQVTAHYRMKHQIMQPIHQRDMHLHADNHYEAEPVRIYAPEQKGKVLVAAHIREGRAFVSRSFFAESQ